jgi:hypothetical protein
MDDLQFGVQNHQEGHAQARHGTGFLDVLPHFVQGGLVPNITFGAGHHPVIPLDGFKRTHTRENHTPAAAVTPQRGLGHADGQAEIGLSKTPVNADGGPIAGDTHKLKIPCLPGFALVDGHTRVHDLIAEFAVQFGLVHLP